MFPKSINVRKLVVINLEAAYWLKPWFLSLLHFYNVKLLDEQEQKSTKLYKKRTKGALMNDGKYAFCYSDSENSGWCGLRVYVVSLPTSLFLFKLTRNLIC